MTENVKAKLNNLTSKEYRNNRDKSISIDKEFYSSPDKQTDCFKLMAELEKPLLFDNDIFGFNRYTDFVVPHRGGNFLPDYENVLNSGFDKLISDINKSIQNTNDLKKQTYGKNMLELLEICLEIVDNYKNYAKEQGNLKLYNALLKVPRNKPETFYEALVFLKISIYLLRLYGVSHLALGRFDLYMYPFYINDKKDGKTDDEIFELLEEFFISLNYDADLYHGMQQGDNGQSMVLGGIDVGGKSVYNELSQMCLKASLELSIIDPKINLRVNKDTPDEIFEYATLLTKQGLGFPQYSNDDVVIPGLLKLGYDHIDAINYAIAACWEFIIPGKGADIPNIETMDFPKIVNDAIIANLLDCNSFDELLKCVNQGIKEEAERLILSVKDKFLAPITLHSIFMTGCIDSLTDMSNGGTKYLNFGCHGAGISNAADALSSVKQNIYEEENITKEELLNALSSDYEGFETVRNLMKNSPKMGNNDDFVDDIASSIMKTFSESMNNRDNGHGGIWRAGTGSAMEYLWKGEECPATADGRKSKEPYASSFSPSLDVKTTGILSVIQSFTKHDMTEIINGGPLTIEIHDTVLKNDIGIKKTAMLVKSFINLGGHQLQLNAINRERLIDAQAHPEKYPNLIVRVWGWSGYFNELDTKYQNHIIRRCEYNI